MSPHKSPSLILPLPSHLAVVTIACLWISACSSDSPAPGIDASDDSDASEDNEPDSTDDCSALWTFSKFPLNAAQTQSSLVVDAEETTGLLRKPNGEDISESFLSWEQVAGTEETIHVEIEIDSIQLQDTSAHLLLYLNEGFETPASVQISRGNDGLTLTGSLANQPLTPQKISDGALTVALGRGNGMATLSVNGTKSPVNLSQPYTPASDARFQMQLGNSSGVARGQNQVTFDSVDVQIAGTSKKDDFECLRIECGDTENCAELR